MEDRRASGLLGAIESVLEGKWSGWIVNALVIPALLIIALLLPPISIKERVFEAGFMAIDRGGGSVMETDGTQLTLPSEGIKAPLRVQLSAIPRTQFLEGSAGKALRAAAEKIPQHLVMRSPLYTVAIRGDAPKQAALSIPIPNDSEPYSKLDVYEWTGEAWSWLPSTVVEEDDRIEARLDKAPAYFAVFQTAARPPTLSAGLNTGGKLQPQAGDALSELNPCGLYMGGDGSIMGNLPAAVTGAKDSRLSIIPSIANWGPDGVVRSDLLDNMLVTPAQRDAHINAIVNLAMGNVYRGVEINYRGLNPDLKGEYVVFINKLADALHAKNKLLAVRVDTPAPVAEDRWNTGAYDWPALGRAVDSFRFDAPPAPDAWKAGGAMQRLLTWAVGQVDRYKLQPVISMHSLEIVGRTMTNVSYTQALSAFSSVVVQGKVVNPGQAVTFALKAATEAGGVQFDPEISAYHFAFPDDDGQVHTIYLQNAASLGHKLRVLSQYNLRGLVLDNLLGEDNDQLVWPLVREYNQLNIAPAQNMFTAVWTVRKAGGAAIASEPRPLQDPAFRWTAPKEPGEYTIDLSISDDGGKTMYVGTRVALIVASPTPTFTPTPTPTPLPTATPTPTSTSTPPPTNTPVPATATPKPANTPSSPASVPRNTSFGFGIQAHWIYNDPGQLVNHIKAIGFNWTKQQIEWKAHEAGGKGQYSWEEIDKLVNVCNANGINLLLSVVKAPAWARPGGADLSVEGPPANPQDFADFLAAMAARYKGRVQAYEIWNEQNLHYEWGNQPINAGQYIELLKRAYTAIKSQDPNAIVVSGAMTPTGVNNGTTAIDDVLYLEQMYQAGLKNYCDAIGAHPSGYNNPPDAKFGYNDPQEPAFKNHPSFFFRDTMERYRNVMVAYGDSAKKIWPTEFGWASVENLAPAPAPGYEYAANVTEGEQAQYVVRAYEMARNWGWVGVMFLWNLNYAPIAGPQDEKAAFGIVRSDWSQRPVFAALAAMPK